MRNEQGLSHIFGRKYRETVERVASRPREIPKVFLHTAGSEEDREKFFKSLNQLPDQKNLAPWKSQNSIERVTEAVERGILIDTLETQIRDLAEYRIGRHEQDRVQRIEDFVKSYDRSQATIVERSWKSNEGRFITLLPKDDYYDLKHSRNEYVISKKAQKEVRDTTFVLIGMGVGSSIAYALALSGAEKFVVVDGGDIKVKDGNRNPAYGISEIGRNHAASWIEKALEQNPYMDITCHDQNAGTEQLPVTKLLKNISGKKVVLEVADSLDVKLQARDETDVDMATDLGYAGRWHSDKKGTYFQGRLTQKIIDALKQKRQISKKEKGQIALQMVGPRGIPKKYIEAFNQAEEEGFPSWPQPGIAALLTAAMVTTAVFMRAEGEQVKTETTVDLWKALKQPRIRTVFQRTAKRE